MRHRLIQKEIEKRVKEKGREREREREEKRKEKKMSFKNGMLHTRYIGIMVQSKRRINFLSLRR